jgi:hypothetical protein
VLHRFYVWRGQSETLHLVARFGRAYATLTVAFLYSFNNSANDASVRAQANYTAAPMQISSNTWFQNPDQRTHC